MKKTIIFILLFSTTILAKAQIDYNKVNTFLYVNGGANMASFFQPQSKSSLEDFSAIFTPQVGLSIRTEFPLSHIGYEIGGQLARRGTKFGNTGETAEIDYAHLYGDLLLYFPLKNYDDIYVGLGLYGGYAFQGSLKDSSGKSTDIKFGKEYDWRALDGGISFKSVYSIKNTLSIGIRYDFGFFPTYLTVDSRGLDNNANNSVLTLSLGLRLARLSKP